MKSISSACMFAAGIALTNFHGLLLAQTNTNTNPVIITASRNDTLLEFMPSSTTIISRQDIEKSQAQTVDQLLKTVPGFNFYGPPSYLSDPTGTQTKMRGLGNDKVLVLLDGIPIIDPFYETTQWFRVPLATIERIEIMRGGASSTWGSMAVAGVVNMISKTPTDNSTEISTSAGSQGSNVVNISKNWLVSESLKINFSANRFETKGYQTTPAAYLWMYPDKQAPTDVNGAYQMSAYFTPGEGNKAFLKLGTFSQNQNLYGVYGLNLQKSPNISAGITTTIDDRTSWDHRLWAQNVSFDKTNGASCYLNGSGQTSANCLNGGGTAPSLLQAATDPVGNYYTQHGLQYYTERGASSVYSQYLNGFWNSFQLGADYRQLSVTDQEYYFGAPTVANSAFSSQENLSYLLNGSGTQTFIGLFAQGKFSPVPSLQITISARYDDWINSNRNYALINSTGIASAGSGPVGNISKNQIDPSVGLHWDIDDEWSLRSSAYRAFRVPGLNNQTRSYGSTIANPNLTPETVTGWEIGGDFKDHALKFGITYFANTLSNMIATSAYTASTGYPQPVLNLCSTNGSNVVNCAVNGTVNYYTNNQNGQANGLELTGKWAVNRQWMVDSFYTYTHSYLTGTWNNVTTPLNTQLTGIPRSSASLAVTWLPTSKLRVYLQTYYIGPMSYQQTGNTSGAVLANYVQPGNSILNGSINYAYDRSTDLYFNATNLLNHVYQEGTYQASMPQAMSLSPPRTVMAGLRYRF